MKKNKTSNRQKAGYKRLDLRKGGRVKLHAGKEIMIDTGTGEPESYIQHDNSNHTQADHNNDGTVTLTPEQQAAADKAAADKAAAEAEAAAKKAAAEKEAADKAAAQTKTREQMAQALAGDTSFMPQIDDPILVEEGEQLEADSIAKKDDLTVKKAEMPDLVDAGQVTTTAQAKAPAGLTAQTVDAELVTQAPEVTAATGTVSEDAQADAAKVTRVDPIEAATVEIIPGALTERVVGTLSDGAKSQAAQIAGVSLARITRAKTQLRKAGLSAEDITELGNDPETLEARLADFTETQRGLIAGLPEEALVSNQLDSLLVGIEEGNIPTWARPAVASVEAMLAQRGMSASTVGRDALLNAIIQSAVPMAQANAQAIQVSISQDKTADIKQAEFNQQTAITNANNVFQMDLAQFSSDQQIALSNSKFLQTVGLEEANNRQQATIQNAVLMSQANLAEADFYQKTQINNANAFLQMDLSNLSNKQQANILRAQNEQQTLLSNQSAINASRQFNATSENQTQQFMAGLANDVEKFNAAQINNVEMFNTEQTNARQALAFASEVDLNKANANMTNQMKQFNAESEFKRDRFNIENARIVEQSNLAWRRQVNTVNTAAQNDVNMQNSINSFNISSQALSFMWQELRDEADYAFKSSENEKARLAALLSTAVASDPDRYAAYSSQISTLIGLFMDTGG